MALHNPVPGLGMVPEYQISGIPATGFVRGGGGGVLAEATFTRVTSAVTVWATAGDAEITFDNALGSVSVELTQNVVYRFEIKTKYLRWTDGSTIFFIAELTSIDGNKCPVWTNTGDELFTIT